MKRTFIILILIIFYFEIHSCKDFSVFDVKNKKLNNKTNNKSSLNKKIKDNSTNIEDLKNRAKRIACLSLIRNSLKNQTSELKQFLQNHKKAYFSYFKKITDHCKEKITEDQASNILTNKNVTFNESIPEYKELIFNDYVKNLNLDDDFIAKNKKNNKKNDKKNKKKGTKKEKIMKILTIGGCCIFLLVLLYLFFVFKDKSNTLSKNNIEKLKNKDKNNKKKTD